MLRAIVFGVGILLCAGGTIGLALGTGPETPGLLILGILIIAGTLFERRYHSNQPGSPGVGWERTTESFKDPTSGERIEVWFNPHNGQRCYVVSK